MEIKEKEKWLKFYKNNLLANTIPFWEKFSLDKEFGGFLTILDADGTPVTTDKPMWIIGREAWMFARLFNRVEKRQEWLELSKHGIDFIKKFGFDDDGRMFYSVTRDGRPLRKRRYLYTETFGVVALAEYALASGDESAKQQAIDLFKTIIKHHKTEGLLVPKVFAKTRKTKAHAMPMILLATSQVLRQIDDNPLYNQVINESIDEVFRDFLKPEFKALVETVGVDGEFIDQPEGREINPGHAIETAWFIMEEAKERQDKDLVKKACQILDWSLEWGWDEEFGGIFYFRDVKGKPTLKYEHDMKLWWPHIESIYACLLAYSLTGEEKYGQWHKKIHEWSYQRFSDSQNGEWYGYLHRDGSLSCSLKGSYWKGPFHLPRMELNCWKLLEENKQ